MGDWASRAPSSAPALCVSAVTWGLVTPAAAPGSQGFVGGEQALGRLPVWEALRDEATFGASTARSLQGGVPVLAPTHPPNSTRRGS